MSSEKRDGVRNDTAAGRTGLGVEQTSSVAPERNLFGFPGRDGGSSIPAETSSYRSKEPSNQNFSSGNSRSDSSQVSHGKTSKNSLPHPFHPWQNDTQPPTRTTSVPSSGFTPLDTPTPTCNRPADLPEWVSPREVSTRSLLMRGTSVESEFFKPIIDGKKHRHSASTGGAADQHGFGEGKTGSAIDSAGHLPGAAPAAGIRRSGSHGQKILIGSRRDSSRKESKRREISRSDSVAQEHKEHNTRVLFINNPDLSRERSAAAPNKIRTSKYTLLSFLPKNLFEQYHRYAYIYFTIIVVLNQIPQLAVFGRTASLFPLLFVLIVTAIKDAYEDWGRHKSDRDENNRVSLVYQDGSYMPKKWKHICVGEVVKLHDNEAVPCDIVLLGTSDPSGVAYVETMNLDGESNLKSRYATLATAENHPETDPGSGTLICEKPNRNIYEFTAYMDLGGAHLPLGPKNIILRGCDIRNTSWVVGVVVYAGQETKALLNSSAAQTKRTKLEKEMNRETIWLGLFLLVICLIGGVGMTQWVARHSDDLNVIPYYRKKDDEDKPFRYSGAIGEGVIGFLSCIIVFQVLIPISLYISMELVRLGQAYFMSRDRSLYYEPTDTPLHCRALNINEDLGQIKYVFSDKTGTLTENKMEFFAASINGVNFGNGEFQGEFLGEVGRPSKAGAAVQELSSRRLWKPRVETRIDQNLAQHLVHSSSSKLTQAIHDYFVVLAVCNTIVPSRTEVSSDEQNIEFSCARKAGLVEYRGESPDEQALVAAAATYGYTLMDRTSTYVEIDILGEIQRFEILGIHEFDSVRKRMSVVVRFPDGTVKVLMKGADSVVLSITEEAGLQEPSAPGSQAEISRATSRHLDEYARKGLRTLVIATRTLGAEVLQRWDAQYRKANTAVADRPVMLQAAADLIEVNLTLVGATGIEDRLQEGVPETIALLREANMQVWVLTGDKQETAISIAVSSSLLTQDMHQIIINEITPDGCANALASAKALVESDRGETVQTQNGFQRVFKKTPKNVSDGGSPPGHESVQDFLDTRQSTGIVREQPFALIIDGSSLIHCLNGDLEEKLFNVSVACKVVVCCRVAPLQKAAVVSLVKRRAKELTLAVGDGANDVSMIQMADVGIGISGQEGRQAVMASDFSIGQFRFLKRLLLVHGHWNYTRLGYMVLYNFYRNAVFVFLLYWYIFYTAFSPQSALSDWNRVLFSLIYTSVPTIVVGILDKDVSDKTLLRYPGLYSVGQKRLAYNQPLFWATMLDTVWQSLVVFYVPYMSYRHGTVGIYGLGSLWTIAVVVVVNVHLAMDIKHWTWIHHASIWLSILATWICIFVMDSFSSTEGLTTEYMVVYHMVTGWSYWFDLLLITVMALLPRFVFKVIFDLFLKSDTQVAREIEINGHGSNDRSGQGCEMREVPHLSKSDSIRPPQDV